MKQNLTLLSMISLFILFLSCSDKDDSITVGAITLSDKTPNPGSTLKITYQGEANPKNLEYATVNYLVFDNVYYKDLNFDDSTTATIDLPDSAQAIVINIPSKQLEFETYKGEGYIFPLFKPGTKNAVEHAELATAYFTLTTGKKQNWTNDFTATYDAFKTKFKESKDQNVWLPSYIELAQTYDDSFHTNILPKLESDLSKKDELTEEEYTALYHAYKSVKNEHKMDSIQRILIEHFPTNEISIRSTYTAFRKEKNYDKKVELFNELKTSVNNTHPVITYMQIQLAEREYNNENIDEYISTLSKVKNPTIVANELNNKAWDLAIENNNLDVAEKLSEKSLELITKEKQELKYPPTYYSPNEYKQSIEYSESNLADTYALIQFEKGNIADAVKYQKIAVRDGQNSNFNEKYINYLLLDNQFEEAVNHSKEFIREGNSNAKLQDAFKIAYSKINSNTDDADSILTNLLKEAYEKKYAEIKELMVNEPSPEFTVKDRNGDLIHSSAFNNKTIIIDFWATWCGPCISSFPSMQEYVNENQNSDVAFLFVNTFENSPERETDVETFLAENNYTFPVYYDRPDRNTEEFEVANAFGVTVIPTKFLIGKDGNIKFKIVGFTTAEEQKNELDMMRSILNEKDE